MVEVYDTPTTPNQHPSHHPPPCAHETQNQTTSSANHNTTSKTTMALPPPIRMALRQASELSPRPISNARNVTRIREFRATNASSLSYHALSHQADARKRALSSSRPIVSVSPSILSGKQRMCNFSSTPPQPSTSSSPSGGPSSGAPARSTSDPYAEDSGSSNKGIFAKLWDRYSFEGQTKRIILGERLFRGAQFRANDM